MSQRNLLILGLVLATVAAGLIYLIARQDGTDPIEDQAPAPTADLAGQVVDTTGRPVAGADVFAGEAHRRADADGHFRFDDLPAEELPVDVTADGYKRAGAGPLGRPVIDLSDGQPRQGLEFVVGRAASITGRIVAGPDPVDGATVNLNYLFADGLDGQPLDPHIVSNVAESGADGRFEIEALAPGRLQVMVESDDHPFTESREFYLRPGRHIDDLIIDVAPAAELAGQVVSEWGDPLQASVVLTPRAPGFRARRVDTDDAGRFRFERLEAGNYELEARADHYRPALIEDFHVGGEGVDDLELVLEERRGLYGQVVDENGDAVPDAFAVIEDENGQRLTRIRTGADGRFEWRQAPQDQPIWLYADSPAHQASSRRQGTLDEEMRLQVTTGGVVYGRVVDPDGEAVTDFDLGVSYVEFDDDARYTTRQMPRENVTDRQGAFEFGPLRSGRYRLMVEADGYPGATTDALNIRAGDRLGPITIELEENASLDGFITDSETGEPVADAQVYFSLHTPSNRQPSTVTDEDGYYELTELPAGRSSLRVIHDMYIFEHFGGIEIASGGQHSADFEIESIGDGPPGQVMQGIGAGLSRVDDGFRVSQVFDDSPAGQAGLADGDIITAVGDQPVQQMTMDQVVEMIRGRPGTSVTLQIQRDRRGTRNVEVERGRVFIEQDRVVRGRLD